MKSVQISIQLNMRSAYKRWKGAFLKMNSKMGHFSLGESGQLNVREKKRVTCDVIDWMKDWTFKFDCSINMCSPLLVTKAKLDRERHEHLQTTRTHLKKGSGEKKTSEWLRTQLELGLKQHSKKHTPRDTKECKLRSKTWWFTEFCNSHWLSHFAAFFIDLGAKISVAKSCAYKIIISYKKRRRTNSFSRKRELCAPKYIKNRYKEFVCIDEGKKVVCTKRIETPFGTPLKCENEFNKESKM